jgi:formylglycine-generating enzyme required for sulfatase activity
LGSNNANCDGCGSQWDNKQAAPVGNFNANPFGLHDMSGNVLEWTCSNWRAQFDGTEQQCNNNTEDTQLRVLRGGSWNNRPDNVRSSRRYYVHPDARVSGIGFRVLCSSPIE